MNEIIATIIAGLPYLLLAFVFIGLLWAYYSILEWALKSRRVWVVAFLVLTPLGLFLTFIAYLIGGLV